MGHEAIVYGVIVGASYRIGEDYRLLQDYNAAIIRKLRTEDDWIWLVRSAFALPGQYPQGTYRRQIIHFGLSIKDDPSDRGCWDIWFEKFEEVLKRLYWLSAKVHIETDFEPDRMFIYLPTDESLTDLYADKPSPISKWRRSVKILDNLPRDI